MVRCYSTGDGNVSFHKGTLAPPGEYYWTCANTIELVHPSAHWSPQPKRQTDRFSRFLHSLRQKVPTLYNEHPCPPKLPRPMGDLDLPCNTWCFRPMRVHNPNGTSISSVVFAQMTAACLYFTMVCLFPLSKLPLPMLASGPRNTWFIAPTRVRNTNGNLIVSAVFCRDH